jgi:hypothetical protein
VAMSGITPPSSGSLKLRLSLPLMSNVGRHRHRGGHAYALGV